MSKQVISLHVLAMVLGLVVLVVSLFSAAQLTTDAHGSASGRTWYWSKEILPDHVAYPLLMLVDRVALDSAHEPRTRVYMQVNYAYRRLQAAQKLAQKQKSNLALTTLTKAQKYLNQAAVEALESEIDRADKRMVMRAIQLQNQAVQELQPSFTTFDQGVLSSLRGESEILEQKLLDDLEK